MLRKLMVLLQNIDPEQVKALVGFVNELLSLFGQGSQRQLSAAGAEEGSDYKALVETLKNKGVEDDEAQALANRLPS